MFKSKWLSKIDVSEPKVELPSLSFFCSLSGTSWIWMWKMSPFCMQSGNYHHNFHPVLLCHSCLCFCQTCSPEINFQSSRPSHIVLLTCFYFSLFSFLFFWVQEEQHLKDASMTSSSTANAPGEPEPEGGKLNKTQQLKKVFKEYGAVGVSFHICISLMSLGMFYLLISR